jgi:DNA-binding transcriptional ArsR family regulator
MAIVESRHPIKIRNTRKKAFTSNFARRKLVVKELSEPNKISAEDVEIQKKLAVLALVNKLDNVFKAAPQSGASRDTIYRHLTLVKQGGAHALRQQETPDIQHKHCVDMAIEEAVIQFSLKHPHLGPQRIALKMTEALRVDVSAGGVRSIWLRNNLNTTALRVENSKASQKPALKNVQGN